ncbi:L,D-transpeptidase family protein [Nocardioides sp. SYSU D00038]|uniref:L,D-transpeptidase family protein n=1 Tax=Nocardioides sp. SYSU D00038 TaxID=2812554 RepID=UPI00196836E7|nr:L,D-transpeptidase family protein [Nocardioides sp. SYSU D00038]
MTSLRRAALGLLTLALLATTAFAVGYAQRQQARADAPDPERVVVPVADTPDDVPTVAAPEPDPPRGPRPDPASQPGPTVLGPGDEGPAVRDLQARLKQLAWYSEDVDGVYGDHTVEAVEGFQDKRGFPVTGEVDQRTLKRLRSMSTTPTQEQLHNGNVNQPGRLDPRCRTGRALCVDKSSRTLRWVVDGEVRKTVDVRFGSDYTPTREGVFEVYLKSRDHVSRLYDTPMPFALFFSGGQAVHYSADFAATGYGGASHGCVNVRDRSGVEWLFDQVEVGDRVVVYWS